MHCHRIIRRTLTLTSFAILAGSPLLAQSHDWSDLGFGNGPQLEASTPRYGRPLVFRVSNAPPGAPMAVALGLNRINVAILGGFLIPNPQILLPAMTDAAGDGSARVYIPPLCLPDAPLYAQAVIADIPGAMFSFSNAITATLVQDVPSDFNGDGRSDIAVGITGEKISGEADAGAVVVRYGGDALPSEQIHQGSDTNGNIKQTPEQGDRFGSALAYGDFNGDGYDDCAVGVPRETLESIAGANSCGIVQVIYGSAQGLQGGLFGRNDQIFRQGEGGLAGWVPETLDGFGHSLATGDFNGDGYEDLVIGAPDEEAGVVGNDRGVIHVLFGSPSGLSSQGAIDRIGNQDNELLGWSLAADDFNSDGFDEVAIGRRGETVGGNTYAGAVTIWSPTALFLSHEFHQNTPGVRGLAHQGDQFGYALAVGNFNGDDSPDLAIGVPWEDKNGVSDAGQVQVLFGQADVGLVTAGDQLFDQAMLAGTPNADNRLGFALAAGDFDRNGVCDLGISNHREMIGTDEVGALHVMYGVAGVGLSTVGNQMWHQDVSGMADSAEAGDLFTSSLFAGDFDGDWYSDIAVGIAGEDVAGKSDAGAMHLLYGGAAGISTTGNQFLTQGPLDGTTEAGDNLGSAMCGSPAHY